jgi:YidC/Oxa1 family membrane protein insertase
MPDDAPNRFLRILLPLLILIGGAGIAFSIISAQQRSHTPPASATPAQTTPAATPTPTTPGSTAAAPDAPPAAPSAGPDAATQAPAQAPAAVTPAPIAGLFVRSVPAATYATLGDLTPADKGGTHQIRLSFSPFGAGVEKLELANHFQTIKKTEHEVVQKHYTPPAPANQRLGAVPFAAEAVIVNGQKVVVAIDPRDADGKTTFWRELAPGDFEAIIADASGADVVRLRRTYKLEPGSYEFLIEQRAENLTGSPMTIVWEQFGPVDLPLGTVRYGGDVRRVRFGYMRDVKLNPTRAVEAARFLTSHHDALGSQENGVWPPKVLWPNRESTAENLALAWAAMTSRYFVVAVHNPVAPPAAPAGTGAAPADKTFTLAERIERFAMPAPPDVHRGGRGPEGYVVLRLVSPTKTVAPGQSANLSLAAYAGPLTNKYLDTEPRAAAVDLGEAVIYTFGGPCAFCTFQSITWLLRSFLGFLHDNVVFDWALAIMLLVVCVRTILHPVTRWSQISLMRFGKQMQALAPKQKALQEKYKDDPKKMREELARLMREENIQYSGALGCLPMFLQMPIWIALYAMIYFTFELRHEHAFFGVFQVLTGHSWAFLGDLAEPDHFISFGHQIWIPLLSGLMGPIEALNILPLILGVVFYIQQKYMQPPQTTQMTPEMEAQMKMMKVMTVVMFPLFMYNAPAGLSLYFMVNSTLAIIETRHIRKKAEKMDFTPKPRTKGGKPGDKSAPAGEGFFARIQKRVEEQQKLAEQLRQQKMRQEKKKGGK